MGGRGTQFDSEFFDFWAIQDVTRVDREFPKSLTRDYYLFADHSIGIVYFAIRLERGNEKSGEIVRLCPPHGNSDEKLEFAFDNFESFLQAYLDGPIRNCL